MSADDDRRAIIDLTIEYCWAIDEGRFEDLHKVFAPDVVVDLGSGVENGIEAIVARVSAVLLPMDASHHMVTNHSVALGGDTATCRCYFQAQHVRRGFDGGRNFIVAGTYEDDVVRTEVGWRISRRTLSTKWTDGNRAVFESDG